MSDQITVILIRLNERFRVFQMFCNQSCLRHSHICLTSSQCDFLMTLLEKVAKSTCIIKSHLMIDKVMDARKERMRFDKVG
jgi:hypothetical protein